MKTIYSIIIGKMDYSRLKRFDRFVAKRLVKAPEGDFREWNKIREWAEELLLRTVNLNIFKP